MLHACAIDPPSVVGYRFFNDVFTSKFNSIVLVRPFLSILSLFHMEITLGATKSLHPIMV